MPPKSVFLLSVGLKKIRPSKNALYMMEIKFNRKWLFKNISYFIKISLNECMCVCYIGRLMLMADRIRFMFNINTPNVMCKFASCMRRGGSNVWFLLFFLYENLTTLFHFSFMHLTFVRLLSL